METSIRIVLILVAILIIVGIVWDSMRARRATTHKQSNPPSLTKVQSVDTRYALHDAFEDDVILISPTNAESMAISDVQAIAAPITSMSAQRRIEETQLDNPIEFPEEPSFTQMIMILNVMARQPGFFSGKKLLEAFKEAHLFYGEMQIFHRHQNADGSGKTMFSLASAVEPGIFNLSKMDTFVTPGLTLFFNPTSSNQAIAAFELMLRIGKLLALRLDGELRDHQRRVLTLQGIEGYREKMRKLPASNSPVMS